MVHLGFVYKVDSVPFDAYDNLVWFTWIRFKDVSYFMLGSPLMKPIPMKQQLVWEEKKWKEKKK